MAPTPSTASASGSGSSVGSGVMGTVTPPQMPIPVGRNTSGDSCSHYRLETAQVCRQPRSCYDCLNVELPSAQGGCVLNGVGACQAIELYIPSRDYRADRNDTPLSSAYLNYFPSVNASYCQPSDPACNRCAQIAQSTSPSLSDTTVSSFNGSLEQVERFCVGVNGCVCVAACEADAWIESVMEDCSVEDDNTDAKLVYETDSFHTMLPLFMAIQIALIFMVIRRQRAFGGIMGRRPAPPRTAQPGPYNSAAISSPSNRLELTGWRQMQEELVQREKAQRGLVSLMSPANDTSRSNQPPVATSPLSTNTPSAAAAAAAVSHYYTAMTIHEHDVMVDTPQQDSEDEDIPELPIGSPRRRGSTNASVAMLEDGRMSDIIMRRPTATSIHEERETRFE